MNKTIRLFAMFAMLVLGFGVFLAGCSDDDDDVVPTPAPVADFSADNTSGLTVQFTDSSTGSIDTYSWDFGDNTTSTEQNPTHTYDNAATYTVALTVTGPGGSDTATKDITVTVAPPPLQAFEFTDENMVEAAGLGAEVSNFISGLGGVTVDILFNLAVPDGLPLSVRPMVDNVPIGICQNFPDGTATADWDNTVPGEISAGDNVTVTFDNCVISSGPMLSGTGSFTFDNAALSSFPIGTAEMSATVDLTVEEEGDDTIVFTGNFHMTYASETGESFDFVIGNGGGTELLTLTGGVGTIQFGCFDAPLTFNPDNVLLSPRGVVNFNNLYIMQLGDYGVPVDNNPLVFGYVGDTVVAPGPYAGQLKQLSFDDRPNQDPPLPACSAVGSTVHEGNTSLLVEATSGDPLGETYPVRIDRFDNTTWTPPPAGTDNTMFWDDF